MLFRQVRPAFRCNLSLQTRSLSFHQGSASKLLAIQNKGTAFSKQERELFRLRGLFPPAVETLERQKLRAYLQFNSISNDLDKYNFLMRIKNQNETLFYSLLIDHLEQMCPIVYTPTVGKACEQYAQIFRMAEGMHFCRDDKGEMRAMLDNWPSDVAIIVVTDGSRILGLGDLGTNGMGIPVGKLALYIAGGGFEPASTLPMVMDTGTNNKRFQDDPLYLGCRHARLPDPEYYALFDELVMAIKDKWPNAILQFEDISNNHCFNLLDRYKGQTNCFNDDIQGTGAVIAAGYLSANRLAKVPLDDQRIVFFGAGAAGVGVADQIAVCLATTNGVSVDSVRQKVYLVDSKGLVTTTRGDELQAHKVRYARTEGVEIPTLLEVVQTLKPTALIGLAGQPGAFCPDILKAMGELNQRPIIFALSNPTDKAECTAEQAYYATDGRAIFASGSPFKPVTLPSGQTIFPGQGNNMYIFPGLGFGAYLARSKVSEGMVTAAAACLASQVGPSDLEIGRIYPSIQNIREISAHIAVAVMEQSFKEGLARIERPKGDLLTLVRTKMYKPEYINYVEAALSHIH